MKLGIFPISDSKFNPANITINGNKIIETSENSNSVNVLELLETLGMVDPKMVSNKEKLDSLKNVLSKLLSL